MTRVVPYDDSKEGVLSLENMNPDFNGDGIVSPTEQNVYNRMIAADADKDGFLNKAERNAMRLATKKFSDDRHDEIRRARERRGGGREGGSPKPPARWRALGRFLLMGDGD